jgi:hypothetical protein
MTCVTDVGLFQRFENPMTFLSALSEQNNVALYKISIM